MDSDWIHSSLRLTIGVYFLVSGFAKLVQPNAERYRIIARYRLIPASAIRLTAKLLPISEVFLALGLLTGVALGIAAVAIVFLLALIATMLLVSTARGDRHACGCLGDLVARQTGWGLFLQNLALIAGAMILAFTSFSRSLDFSSRPIWRVIWSSGSDGIAIVLLSLGSLALMLLWAYAESNLYAFDVFRSRLAQSGHESDRGL